MLRKFREEENVPLMANTLKFVLVRRVSLDAQTCCQDKLPDGGGETREEGVKGLYVVICVSEIHCPNALGQNTIDCRP